MSLGYHGKIITEATSHSTWENVGNVIPLIDGADRIKIVSSSLHAEKARVYLWRLRPDLADRLVAAADYRFGDLILVKPLLAVIGLRNLRHLSQRQPQQPGAL
ncbi:MAG TPA: ElyC/SanA/YdcF family protein [Microlunatus sp.]